MRYIVTKEIKSETQVVWILYLQDGAFLLIWTVLVLLLKEQVHNMLRIPYLVFSGLIGIRLVLRSSGNPKRRYYQSIAIYLMRPRYVYRYFKERKYEKERNQTYQRRHTYQRL